MSRPRLEVADVLHGYGVSYHQQYGPVPVEHLRVIRAIEICRTAALGGHLDRCDACGHQVISYNSCRNRHCPKCQALTKARWLEARRSELLPVPHFHVVFTIPDILAPLALQNKKLLYNILFRSAAQTLITIGADPKFLGARIGFIAILHSWGQNLMHHPHLHCLVPGGGLDPNGESWIPSRKNFFLPVRVLSRLFRSLFLKQLRNAFHRGRLHFFGKLRRLTNTDQFVDLIHAARSVEWVVYSKPPFGGAHKVLDYLGRYTHRIAISNHRLVSMRDGTVSFRWRDYKHGKQERIMTLKAEEFIRRFLLHVLPHRYMRMRSFGILANCHRRNMLSLCRAALGLPEIQHERELPHWTEIFERLTGKDPLRCPKCGKGHLIRTQLLESITTPVKEGVRAPPR